MAIGIYALYWEKPTLIYIGQSVDIKRRYTTHKYKMQNKKHINYIQEVYSLYGLPTLYTLQECTLEELDIYETSWISEFDTLNYLSTGQGGKIGYESPRCLATKEQVLQTAILLCEVSNTDKYIRSITNVSIGTLESIKYRKRHSWLSEEYPDIWAKLKEVKRFSIGQESRFKTKAIIIDPLGFEHCIYNIAKFAKENGLNNGHLAAVLRGRELQHKGWTLKEMEASDE